ncbi:MAG: agmatine deiminase family protein [Pseudomonadota bacterium]
MSEGSSARWFTMMNRRRFCQSLGAFSVLPLLPAFGMPARWSLPAEESKHAATWMSWPTALSIYEDRAYMESVQEQLAQFAAAIAQYEPVFMAAPLKEFAQVSELCGPDVQLVDIPSNDMWMRDTGPVFVTGRGGVLAAVNLNFNGWGDKQQPRAADEQMAARVAEHLGVDQITTQLVGEGGGMECDGDGTLILTESCWLNDNRNAGVSKSDMTAELKRVFGVEKVIWVPGVRGQDITDGHIDGSIRFVRPGLIMTGGYPDDDSDWGLALMEAREILSRETDARGRHFETVDIPSATNPANDSEYLFTSYANFYVANGAVFTPVFGDKRADTVALERLGALFPKRDVVPLSVDLIYENGGGIHCVTQQQPAV